MDVLDQKSLMIYCSDIDKDTMDWDSDVTFTFDTFDVVAKFLYKHDIDLICVCVCVCVCARARVCMCVCLLLLACVTLLLIISMFFTAYIRYLRNLMMNDYIQRLNYKMQMLRLGKMNYNVSVLFSISYFSILKNARTT